jgi:hypothetical protein
VASLGTIQLVMNWAIAGNISSRVLFIFLSLIPLILVFFLGLATYHKDDHIDYLAGVLVTSVVGLVFLVRLGFANKRKEVIHFDVLVYLIFTIAIFSVLLGYTYGLNVKYFGKLHDLTIRGENSNEWAVSGARLILFTSHHLILQIGTSIVTVPTASIRQMTSSAE